MVESGKFKLMLFGILMASGVAAQDQPLNPLPVDSSTTSHLLVCQLSGPELQQRKAELRQEVFGKVNKYEEIPDGYVFYFSDEGDLAMKVADYMLAEKECCPFFNFELAIQAHQKGISWKITGPPEAKDMIRMLIEE